MQHLDTTAVQTLVDVRNQFDRFAAPEQVAWHFAGIRSPWVKRALASVGFGQAFAESKPLFVVSEVAAEQPSGLPDDPADAERERYHNAVPVSSLDRPWFHVDIDSAIAAAVVNYGEDYSQWHGKSDGSPARRPSYGSSDDRKSETKY